MFDADRPITTSGQDKLDRDTFAKYLARCMLDHKDPDSLVVGLYGGWGVGKTSVINLVLEELNFAASNLNDDEKPIILNFSPWSYSGQNQLIYNFFRRLSSTLRSVSYLENADRIVYLLELYVSFFTHQAIPKSLRSKNKSFKNKSFLEKIFSKNSSSENFTSNDEENYAWESGRDLTLVKAELNELLKNQKHKIIIIIDNISRLYDQEIKQIFQIVKSMGDYANTAYLLAFDKEHVVRAIDIVDGGGGEEYVEKIVQLPFAIPPISQQDLEIIFADRLMEIVASIPENTWDAEYWADIYYSSLKYFFENCRDITRYVNTLNFSYLRLRDVVNPVDFFALTALEIFTPDIYFGIRENKDLFTDLLDNVYEFDKEQMQKDKIRCDEILSRNSRDRISPDILLDLLIRLFPRIRHIYHPHEKIYHSDAMARKLKRISSPDLFEVYFRLSMQTGSIPKSEFETLLALASNATGFDHALTRLNQDGRSRKFLDLLDSKILSTIPQQHIQSIISGLLNNGDLFPQGISSPLSLNAPMRIHRIIHGLLHCLQTPEERFLIMQNAIANASKSLYILVHEIQEQGREHSEESDTFVPHEFRDLSSEQLISLRKLVVKRIQDWASNGSLITHPQLLPILFAWRDWGSTEDCRSFVSTATNTDTGLIAFLISTLDPAISQAMMQYQQTPEWEKYLGNINAFIAVNLLELHARTLFEDNYFEKLREREQLALMIFLDLIKSHTQKNIPKTTI
jgi:predicted KAP-like P-loop ATPase